MTVTLFGFHGFPDHAGRDAAERRALDSLADLPAGTTRRLITHDGLLFVRRHDEGETVGDWVTVDGWTCVCDARIDNREALFAELRTRRYLIADEAGNASLLLGVYREFGDRAWDLVEGDFACAIHGGPTMEFVLARDVVGARPLYHAEHAGGVLFASELRTLVALRGSRLGVDLEQAASWLSPRQMGVTAMGRTIFEGVWRVEPGTSLRFRKGRGSETRYWDPATIPRAGRISVADAAVELHDRILKAVLVRSAAAGRLGCHFSGGLDCTSLALMAHVHGGAATADAVHFAWTPDLAATSAASEARRIDAAAALHGLRPEYVDAEALALARQRSAGETRSYLHPRETMYFETCVQSRARALGIRTMLSGWGGDEFASNHGFGVRPELFLQLRWVHLARLLGTRKDGWSSVELIRGLTGLWSDIRGAIRARLPISTDAGLAAESLRRRFPVQSLGHERTVFSVREAQARAYRSGHLVDRMESWYCHGKLAGLSYAYPLLDRRVLEFAISLPGRYFGSSRQGRDVYRRAVARYWPGNLASVVPKEESGIAGFLRDTRVRDNTPPSHPGDYALAAATSGGVAAAIFDVARLRETIARHVAAPSTPSRVQLHRADELASIIGWMAECPTSPAS